MVGGHGVPSSEYWEMTQREVSIFLEAKRPKHVGGIHEDDLHNMMKRRAEMEAQGIKVL